MMRALLITLKGSVRSWGTVSAGDDRWTEPYPTASAVLGMAGACMGVDTNSQEQMSAWYNAFSVCIASATSFVKKSPRPPNAIFYFPELMTDYHTTKKSLSMDGKERLHPTESLRGYITDALDVAAIVPRSYEAEEWLLDLVYAFEQPKFTPYLGRRCNSLSAPPLEPGEGVVEINSVDELCGKLFLRLSGLSIGDLSPSACLLRLPSYLVEQEGYPGENWLTIGQMSIADQRSGPLRTFEHRLVCEFHRSIETEDFAE